MGTPKTIPNKTRAVSKRTKHTNTNDTQQLGPLLWVIHIGQRHHIWRSCSDRDTIYRTIRPALGFLRAAAVEDNASSNAITLFLRANKVKPSVWLLMRTTEQVLFYILDHQKRVERGLTLKVRTQWHHLLILNSQDGIVLVGNLMDLIYDIYSYLALSEGKASPSTELARRKRCSQMMHMRDIPETTLQFIHSREGSLPHRVTDTVDHCPALSLPFSYWHQTPVLGCILCDREHCITHCRIEHLTVRDHEPNGSFDPLLDNSLHWESESSHHVDTAWRTQKLTGSEEPAASSVVQNLELAMRWCNLMWESSDVQKDSWTTWEVGESRKKEV